MGAKTFGFPTFLKISFFVLNRKNKNKDIYNFHFWEDYRFNSTSLII